MIRLLVIAIFPAVLHSQNIKGPVEYNESVAKQKTKLINKIFLCDTIHIKVNRRGCSLPSFYELNLHKRQNYYIGTYSVATGDASKISHQHVLKINQNTLQSIHDLCLYGLTIQEGSCTTKKKFIVSSPNNMVLFNDDRCSDNDDILEKIEKIIKNTKLD
ncbi:MAG: hypothetical protein V4580_19380 [Bacteroidota bacterium]